MAIVPLPLTQSWQIANTPGIAMAEVGRLTTKESRELNPSIGMNINLNRECVFPSTPTMGPWAALGQVMSITVTSAGLILTDWQGCLMHSEHTGV